MQPGSTKITLKIKRDQNGTKSSTLPDHLENTNHPPADISSSSEEDDNNEDAQKQLVVYDPSTNNGDQIEPIPDLNEFQLVPIPKKFHSTKPLPSVGTFTVQCAKCFKWRLIPTKEKYEEIREHILENPFYCETTLEWKADVSCEDPPDISQDGSRLWAIDKPNIAKPPPGWQRLLRIRGEGSYKFADVYYAAPTGKRLRSMIEVQKYLEQHPECAEAGATLSKFSFQCPKPLNENYVKKRPKLPAPDLNNGTTGLLEAPLVNPISWANPDENTDLQHGGPSLSKPFSESPSSEPMTRPKKRAKKPINESTSTFVDQQKVHVDEPCEVPTVEPLPPVKVDELSESINDEIDF